MRSPLLVVTCLCQFFAFGQNPYWEATNFNYEFFGWSFASENDSLNDLAYLGSFQNPDGLPSKALITYDGNGYEMETLMDGPILAIKFYKQSIYIAGTFSTVNDVQAPHIARYSNGVWESIGTFNNSGSTLEVIDDTLYIGGSFTAHEDFPYDYVVKYDGENFHAIEDNPFVGETPWIQSFAKYQGALFIGGNFSHPLDSDLLMYADNEWQPVGEGMSGFATTVRFMEVFQDELYVAGIMNQDEGNAGNFIQKWNGSNWSQVGVGLEHIYPGQIIGMQQFQNALYVNGIFGTAGEAELNGIARWDGEQWCGMHYGGFPFGIGGFFTLGEDIYAPLYGIAGDSFFVESREIYKWIGGDNYGPCDGTVSATELEPNGYKLNLFPNPAKNVVSITNEFSESGNIRVVNTSGQVVLETKNIQAKERVEISVKNLSPGVYAIQLLLEDGEVTTSKLAKQ